jgi:hypothetical protein
VTDFISSDVVTQSEQEFPFPKLLVVDYFKKQREGYYAAREHGLLNLYRNYVKLLTFLTEVNEYNPQHGKSYAKKLRGASSDWKNCEAIFSEIIVYRHYIRTIHEGLIRNIDLNQAECDIIIERIDGSKAYLEVFCVMPDFPRPEAGKFVCYDVKAHTQTAAASIRQKLLRKRSKQKQLSKQRENYAVIELNDVSIAGDFTVLSSLSSGYKITIDKMTRQVIDEGYDWCSSVFDDPGTEFLKGVIYFSLGDYESRKFVFNPKFQSNSSIGSASASI